MIRSYVSYMQRNKMYEEQHQFLVLLNNVH